MSEELDLEVPENFMTEDEVAEWLRISPRTLQDHRYSDRGKGPAYYQLSVNAVRYARREVAQWLLERRRTGREKESGLDPQIVVKALDDFEEIETLHALAEDAKRSPIAAEEMTVKARLKAATVEMREEGQEKSEKKKRSAKDKARFMLVQELADDDGLLFATVAGLLDMIEKRGLPDSPTDRERAAVSAARGILRGTRWQHM